MWSVWDRKSNINGFEADAFLNKNKHLLNEETIFVKSIDGVITEVQGKDILSKIYGIDPSLSDDDFIAAYEKMLAGDEITETETETA